MNTIKILAVYLYLASHYILFRDFRALLRAMLRQSVEVSGYLRPGASPALQVAAEILGYGVKMFGPLEGRAEQLTVTLTREGDGSVTTYDEATAHWMSSLLGPTILSVSVLACADAIDPLGRVATKYGMGLKFVVLGVEERVYHCTVYPNSVFTVGTDT